MVSQKVVWYLILITSGVGDPLDSLGTWPRPHLLCPVMCAVLYRPKGTRESEKAAVSCVAEPRKTMQEF